MEGRTLPFLLASVLLLGLLAPGAHAQFPSCGDIDLVFRNPDLQPQSDGKVHASGQFFIQFQAVGQGADKIEVFAFSFGPDTVEFNEDACDRPVWFTGTYVLNYRADRDPEDGFFIPLQTDIVPDGDYAAAVHAYDGNGNELARFWARAVVDNCDGDGSRCPDDDAQQVAHDTTAPWPIVLPGDGTGLGDHHLTIEFAEEIANLTVYLNGQDISGELAEWDGRVWDSDSIPDYLPGGASDPATAPCSQPVHSCRSYGPAFAWDGRALTDDDVVRVEATDVAGNLATKDIHIGSGVASGAITSDAPNLQITVDAQKKPTRPGQAVVFRFDMQNSGGGDAHPFTSIEAPGQWDAEFLPHEPVPAGARGTQELTVTPPAGTEPGAYTVNATISYSASGREQQRTWNLEVDVGTPQEVTPTTSATSAPSEDEDAPAPGMALVAALGLVAVALRRVHRP